MYWHRTHKTSLRVKKTIRESMPCTMGAWYCGWGDHNLPEDTSCDIFILYKILHYIEYLTISYSLHIRPLHLPQSMGIRVTSGFEFSVCLFVCVSVLGKFSNFFLQYKAAAVRAVLAHSPRRSTGIRVTSGFEFSVCCLSVCLFVCSHKIF